MKIRTLLLLFPLIFLLASLSAAQKKDLQIAGTVKDRAETAHAGITLYFEGGDIKRTAVADEKGNFKVSLPPGRYTVLPDKNIYQAFTVFIMVPEKGPIPTNLPLEVESRKDWCANCAADKQPEVVTYKAPSYPVVALAVAASGEVSVNVKLRSDGSVLSAMAMNGHPFLKNVAAQAARDWTFSPDSSVEERDVTVIFVFTGCNEGQTDSGSFLRKPNRLEIFYCSKIVSN
ncbi:MAG TPA: energy transducer TonB [Pyrinomonadaceae bacterium]|jgi:hypothetical protein|nr:energy transducer TonB [Pyrinomonadaceae bacterium]